MVEKVITTQWQGEAPDCGDSVATDKARHPQSSLFLTSSQFIFIQNAKEPTVWTSLMPI